MATIQQIGRALNLSHTTVSKVLNGRNAHLISEATRERVRLKAAEMGYRPNRAARSLVTGRTHQIALWMRRMATAYDAQVMAGLLKEIEASAYQVVIRSAAGDANQNTLLEAFSSVDGCIFFESVLKRFLPLLQSETERLPVVGMGGAYFQSQDCPEMDFVGVDLHTGAEEALHHLLQAGCARIAFVGPYPFTWDEPRSRAYDAVMAEVGRPPEIIVVSELPRSKVRTAVREYVLANGCPDGLLCFNDDVALGAYRALRDLGRQVPDDVAIVGHDGIEDTEYLDTPITTLVQPVEEMCALAWRYLRARIEEPSMPPQQVLLHTSLVLRASTARPLAAGKAPAPSS